METINVTYRQGGMEKFRRTGIYPKYLLFSSPKHNKAWRARIKGDKRVGTLEIDGKIVYRYSFFVNEEEKANCNVFDTDGNTVQVKMDTELCD